MNKSEDVSKLFAMFGEKNTSQYQEIYESEQNRATRQKWPIFQHIHVDVDSPEQAIATPVKAVTPASKPLFNAFRAGHKEDATSTASHVDPAQFVPVSKFGSQQTDIKHSGNLQSLFKRLDRQEEVPAKKMTIDSTPADQSKPSAIRSLFSRLNRR
jgi:hypothetical protein